MLCDDLEGWASLVAQRLKYLPAMRETWVWTLGWKDPLEKDVATHSSILAWRIPWTEEPCGLKSTGSQRVGHDWATSLSLSFRGVGWRGGREALEEGYLCLFMANLLCCMAETNTKLQSNYPPIKNFKKLKKKVWYLKINEIRFLMLPHK